MLTTIPGRERSSLQVLLWWNTLGKNQEWKRIALTGRLHEAGTMYPFGGRVLRRFRRLHVSRVMSSLSLLITM